MPGKCIFNSLWTTNDKYKEWLAASSDRRKAKCLICKKEFDIARMGESALKVHMSGNKHIELLKIKHASPGVKTLLSQASNSQNSIKDVASPCNNSFANKSSSDITTYMPNEKVLEAEILWVLKCIKSRYSFNSCEGNNKLFRRMFPDSEIAKHFTCGSTKCAYISCFGLAPYYKDILLKCVKQINHFTLLFDETLNQATQQKQLDIHVRYWHSEESQVTTRYWTSAFIGHAKATDILAAFYKSVENLNLSKLLHVSMDGPNVNWKFYEYLQEDMRKNHNREIISVGSCGLHIVNNAFKHGATITSWNIDAILTSLYWVFKDSPARREDFERLSESKKHPIKFCGCRWLENVPAVERAIEIWPDVLKYVGNIEKGDLSKVTCKSFVTIAGAAKDPLIVAKLNFFLAVAKLVQPFMELYQNDKPLLPFFCDDILKLLNQCLQHFNILKPGEKENINSIRKIMKFDFSDSKCYSPVDKISIGFIGDRLIKDKLKHKIVTEKDTLNLQRESRSFVIKMIQSIIAKSPAGYSLVRSISCMDVRKMLSNKEKCLVQMKQVLLHFAEKKIVRGEDCDVLLLQFKDFMENTITKYSSAFENFNPKEMRLDSFLNDFLGMDDSKQKLWDIMKIIMILSHGQASVERGFSVNKSLEVENLKEQSYISQRIIYQNSNASAELHNTVITKEMRKYVSSSRQKYVTHLEEMRNISKQNEAEIKRKRKLDEISYLKSKKVFLQADIVKMEKSAEELSDKAESTKNIALFIKANGLRKEIKEKTNEIKIVDQQISEKERELK